MSGSRSGGSSSRGKLPSRPGRVPAGTPDLLKVHSAREETSERHKQASKVSEQFKTDEFRNWLKARNVSPGFMDMSVSKGEASEGDG
jgi:hypothetical protein